jgi:hypothetical protein
MVLIIFSNRRVCCGILVPAPIIMQSNFSRESVSETTLSAVSPRSTRQCCTSYPSSASLLFAPCATAFTRLASHPVVVAKLRSINLGSMPRKRTFFFAIFSHNSDNYLLSMAGILRSSAIYLVSLSYDWSSGNIEDKQTTRSVGKPRKDSCC